MSEADAALIEAAVNALPVLLAEVEKLEECRRLKAFMRGAIALDELRHMGDQYGDGTEVEAVAAALRRLAATEETE